LFRLGAAKVIKRKVNSKKNGKNLSFFFKTKYKTETKMKEMVLITG